MSRELSLTPGEHGRLHGCMLAPEGRQRHEMSKDLYVAALGIPDDAERHAFLARACGADRELHEEIASLLLFSRPGSPISQSPEVCPLAHARLGPLIPGSLFAGRFEVEELLGEGGTGQVYRVRDTLLDVHVALKRVRVRSPQHRRRLLDEARLARRITHPCVCRIHDVGELEGETFITMELLDGMPLSARLQSGALPASDVRDLGTKLCAGLAAAHDVGVLHGDLKPSNVILLPDGGLRLIDFDLARTRETALQGAFPAGTPAYMSPEQLDPQASIDERTDLHGVGLILHEALTGSPAFDSDGPDGLAEQVLHHDAARARSALDPSGAALEPLIAALLAKDPARRPKSAREVSAILAGGGVEAAASDNAQVSRPPGRLVGRDAEIIRLAVQVPLHRLVTLCGPAGCGKTRLAQEAAWRLRRRFPRGTWLVDVSGLAESDDLLLALARAVAGPGIPQVPPLETIRLALGGRPALILLDGVEQRRGDCARVVAELLAATEGLHVIATGREALGVASEVRHGVEPLAIPGAGLEQWPEALGRVDSVALFMEHASTAHPGIAIDAGTAPAIARICRRLDGIPFAIELAAHALRLMSLGELAESVDEPLPDLASRDPLARAHHRTLKALLDRSHSMLGSEAAHLLRRLSVFRGGFSAEAAKEACAAPPLARGHVRRLLASLVDQSLVQVERAGESVRYRMLSLVRDHARLALEASGELEAMQASHLDALLVLARAAAAPLMGEESGAWTLRLAPEMDNIRAALEFGATSPGRAAPAVGVTVALWPFLEERMHAADLRRCLEALVGHLDPRAEPSAAAWGYYLAGLAAFRLGDHRSSAAHHDRARELSAEAGDRGLLAHARCGLAMNLAESGDLAAAGAQLASALEEARAAGSAAAEFRALMGLGNVALRRGVVHEGIDLYGRARDVAVAGRLARMEFKALSNLAIAHLEAGDVETAEPLLERSLELSRLCDPSIPWISARVSLGSLKRRRGDMAGAAALLQVAHDAAMATGDVVQLPTIALHLSGALIDLGELAAARRCLRDALPGTLASWAPRNMVTLADAAAALRLAEGAAEDAARLWGSATTGRKQVGARLNGTDTGRRTEQRIREALGDAAAERAMSEGAAMPLRALLERSLAP